MKNNMVKPQVQNYIQVQQYLQDVYKFRKAIESGFSYEAWAAELGVSSRSHLRLAILGQRSISDNLAQTFAANLQLLGRDKDYFFLLTLFSQSKDAAQKSYYAKKLADFVSAKVEKKSVAPTEELLKDPTVIALRLLLTFEDVGGSEEELSQQLLVSLSELRAKLQVLHTHDLIYQEAPGKWRATSRWIQFTDHPDNSGIRAYHAASLEAAKNSIHLPVETRYFRSLTWAMNPQEYQSFLTDFGEFIEQMNAKYEKNTLEDRKLMQLNTNLIPTLPLKPS